MSIATENIGAADTACMAGMCSGVRSVERRLRDEEIIYFTADERQVR